MTDSKFKEDPIEKLIKKIVKEVLSDLGVLQMLDEVDRIIGELKKLEEKYESHVHGVSKPSQEVKEQC
jgi:hypothetical protein